MAMFFYIGEFKAQLEAASDF